MEKLYMPIMIGPSGRDRGSKAGLFEGNSFWVGQCDLLTFMLEEELYNF